MKNLEKNLKALANYRRLAILKYLKKNRSASVMEIAERVGMSEKAASKHLRILFTNNVVDREQAGYQVIYSFSEEQASVARHVISLL